MRKSSKLKQKQSIIYDPVLLECLDKFLFNQFNKNENPTEVFNSFRMKINSLYPKNNNPRERLNFCEQVCIFYSKHFFSLYSKTGTDKYLYLTQKPWADQVLATTIAELLLMSDYVFYNFNDLTITDVVTTKSYKRFVLLLPNDLIKDPDGYFLRWIYITLETPLILFNSLTQEIYLAYLQEQEIKWTAFLNSFTITYSSIKDCNEIPSRRKKGFTQDDKFIETVNKYVLSFLGKIKNAHKKRGF